LHLPKLFWNVQDEILDVPEQVSFLPEQILHVPKLFRNIQEEIGNVRDELLDVPEQVSFLPEQILDIRNLDCYEEALIFLGGNLMGYKRRASQIMVDAQQRMAKLQAIDPALDLGEYEMVGGTRTSEIIRKTKPENPAA
jgi:hypothetical protein